MTIVDANIVLRYLLSDVDGLFVRSREIIENEKIYLPFEVIAEIVYVLEKVYKVDRKEIADSLIGILKYPNIETMDFEVVAVALTCYDESRIDFVDSLLFGYRKVRGYTIRSFDKKLNKILNLPA